MSVFDGEVVQSSKIAAGTYAPIWLPDHVQRTRPRGGRTSDDSMTFHLEELGPNRFELVRRKATCLAEHWAPGGLDDMLDSVLRNQGTEGARGDDVGEVPQDQINARDTHCLRSRRYCG